MNKMTLVGALLPVMFMGCSDKGESAGVIKPYAGAHYDFQSQILGEVKNEAPKYLVEEINSYNKTLDGVFLSYDETVDDISVRKRADMSEEQAQNNVRKRNYLTERYGK